MKFGNELMSWRVCLRPDPLSQSYFNFNALIGGAGGEIEGGEEHDVGL